MKIREWVKRKIKDMLDPVTQDPDAIMYTIHDGVAIRLRPAMGADGRIKEWIKDPDEIAALNSLRAKQAATNPPPICGAPAPVPTAAQTQTPAPTAAPGGTGGFNPAGVSGL